MLARRALLRGTAPLGLALGSVSVLAACVPSPSAAPPAGSAPAASATSGTSILPSSIPFGGPPPDLPGGAAAVEPGYVKFQGLYSAEGLHQSAVLRQMIADRVAAMLMGRAPMSDYDQLIADSRSQGVEQIRAEYEQALQGKA